MKFRARHVLASTLTISAALLLTAFAEGQVDPSLEHASPPDKVVQSGQPKVLTGKERLGPKWMDDQRVDNCKVPLDKRGAKPRPDTCS
jgi:hypothetical protein